MKKTLIIKNEHVLDLINQPTMHEEINDKKTKKQQHQQQLLSAQKKAASDGTVAATASKAAFVRTSCF